MLHFAPEVHVADAFVCRKCAIAFADDKPAAGLRANLARCCTFRPIYMAINSRKVACADDE
jgi:hypothetical protein